ncbi:NADP-dependent oxidoreductase [Kitasatospora sp. NPDC096147]|uniref:NADP-dependent oxidoreductase n=1 Tax=Kitasatospora sp. NPDC096147 TaxID=3364093 RepID=UPI00380D27F3
MLATLFREPGGPEVLEVTELPLPAPGPGEVLVRVEAAGIQPADTAIRSGWAPRGVTVEYPATPGNEFAGVVTRLGEGVNGWATGDEVLGFRLLGCHAQYVVVPAEQVVARPAGMDWAEAGSLSASGQTAHVALSALGVTAGDTVLVHAAAGGVGSVAVQLARAWGATVIGTASGANHAYLRSLGAIPVTYGDGLADRVRAVAPHGVDAALDAAGRDALVPSLALVPDRTRIGTIADPAAEGLGVRWLYGPRSAARLAELTALWEQGRLRLTVSAAFPLARAAEAHRLVEAGHVRGKAVILPWAE